MFWWAITRLLTLLLDSFSWRVHQADKDLEILLSNTLFWAAFCTIIIVKQHKRIWHQDGKNEPCLNFPRARSGAIIPKTDNHSIIPTMKVGNSLFQH